MKLTRFFQKIPLQIRYKTGERYVFFVSFFLVLALDQVEGKKVSNEDRKRQFISICNPPNKSQKITLVALAKGGKTNIKFSNCERIYLKLAETNDLHLESQNISDLSPLPPLQDLG